MRPTGEIRQALSKAAEQLAPIYPETGFTFRDLAEVGQVAFEDAQETAKNMARAGQLRKVGTRQVPGSKRPLTTYLPNAGTVADAAQHLASALRCWVPTY
jgi:hypothetical protein